MGETVRQNRLTLAVAVVVGLVLLARLVVYQVRDDEVAVVLTFGRATDDVTAPRTGLKWPWPVQQVRRFDRRLRVQQTPLEEVATRDGRAVLVGSFVLWRVASAQGFLQSLGDADAATRHIEKVLRSRQSETLSRHPFGALVSVDPAQLKYQEIERDLLRLVGDDLRPLGVEVKTVGIRRLGLPEETTEAVFERMKKDREAKAAAIRAEGEAEAGRLRAEADRERDTLLSAAEADARRLMGEAEREAEEAYARLAQDPELAIFLKKLAALEKLLGRRTTLVFDTSEPPFDLLERDWRAGVAPVESGR
ncbi:MAG: hypothetical protein KF878_37470 [Planctomycetes bacterium]|nr:hypothetical protein [Planctomycetota bacterium]